MRVTANLLAIPKIRLSSYFIQMRLETSAQTLFSLTIVALHKCGMN
ncbi:hypothetical protein RintRC_0897 [Richelia intracellularis]|nr:hypothetical protein RintRC_0897 [Richelia intracellularis]